MGKYTSPVYVTLVRYDRVTEDSVQIGTISFDTRDEAFVKAIRLF